jgi:hypothetical protein
VLRDQDSATTIDTAPDSVILIQYNTHETSVGGNVEYNTHETSVGDPDPQNPHVFGPP